MPLSYLYGLRRFGAGPGRPRVARYLAALGYPHRHYPVVQVTGTNGKGSCAAMLAGIAQEAGLRVGLYTSPHLRHFHERMRIDGDCIPDAELAEQVSRLRPYIEAAVQRNPRARPGGFEAFTLVAASWFAAHEVDIVIAEAGIGGAGDATAALEPFFGVLTSVGLDHQAVLGDSVAEIARQKVGAWRSGGRGLLGVTQPALRRGLTKQLRRRGVRVLALDGELRGQEHAGRLSLRSPLGDLDDLPLPLAGAHQARNAALAAAAGLWLGRAGLGIRAPHVRAGLAAVQWPGRLESWALRGARVLLDAAHNPAAAKALCASLPEGPIHLLAGLSEPHDPRPFLSELEAHVGQATFAQARHRGLPVERLEAAWAAREGRARPRLLPDVGSALRSAAQAAREAGATLVVTGSIFLLDEALAVLERDGLRLDRRI